MRNVLQVEEPKVAKPVDDDEDIFGDAGTNYTPELPKSKAGSAAVAAPAPAAAGSYFESKDEMSDLPALPKSGQPSCQPGPHIFCEFPGAHALALLCRNWHLRRPWCMCRAQQEWRCSSG